MKHSERRALKLEIAQRICAISTKPAWLDITPQDYLVLSLPQLQRDLARLEGRKLCERA